MMQLKYLSLFILVLVAVFCHFFNAWPAFAIVSLLYGAGLVVCSYYDQQKIQELKKNKYAVPQNNPNPLFQLDQFGQMVFCNKATLQKFPDIVKEPDHPLLKGLFEIFQDMEKQGKTIAQREVEIGCIVYSQSVAKVQQPDGQYIYNIYCNNITSLKRTQSKLETQKAILNQILNHMPTVLYAKDVDDEYRYVLWNKKSEEMFGLQESHVVGQNDFELYDHSLAQTLRTKDIDIEKDKNVYQCEEVIKDQGGGEWISNTSIVPVYDEQGKTRLLLYIMQDITKRKRDEDILRKYEAVLKYSNDAIIITSTNLEPPGPEIVYVNQAFCEITGYSEQEVIGQSPRFLQGKDTNAEQLSELKMALQEYNDYRGELVNYKKSGEEYWLSISVFPIPDRTGKIVNYAAIERDITARKNGEKQLKEQSEQLVKSKYEAEKANQAKSEFLAMMSHELRTPLNSIIGLAKLLKDTKLTIEQLEMTDTVLNSSSNLLSIVNDILDLSKIEAGEVRIEQIGFDFMTIINSVVETLRPLAQKKKLNLFVEHKTGDIPYIIGDPVQVTKIVTNLIGNAIKYTEEGSVHIQTSFLESFENEIILRFEVQDTGIGIPKNKIRNIFSKFSQADSSTSRKFGGTGLGLAITKQLIEMMGGDIGVTSEERRGSEFWLEVPFKVTDKLYEESVTESKIYQLGESDLIDVNKIEVLAVEDHPLNQIYLKKLLKKLGIVNYDLAVDGKAALDFYEKKDYDLILMDCHLPEINGYELTSYIRQTEKENNKQPIPIIAMTANAMLGDKQKCFNSGMSDYISKPIDDQKLKKLLSQWINFEVVAMDTEQEVADIGLQYQNIVDFSIIKSFSEGDVEMEKEFISVFLMTSQESLQQLSNSCIDGENHEWIEAAHKLKGGAGNVGANKLRELCAVAQDMTSSSREERLAIYSKIENEYQQVVSCFRGKKLCD